MSGIPQGDPTFIFENVPKPARDALTKQFDQAFPNETDRHIKIMDGSIAKPQTHGELVANTILIYASGAAISVIAAWLISLAPPRPRKETIKLSHPDGTKIEKTIEYSKDTSVSALARILSGLLRS